MRILVTNDDGIDAPGLKVAEAIAATLSDDITVICPAEEQSGASHSLTLTRPVRMRQLDERRYAVAGTPTDCVMMALEWIMKDGPPELILSGVNRGSNLAEDVTYSGTVAGAIEGALAGIPAIALSQVYARAGMGDTVPFAAAMAWGERTVRPLLDVAWTPGMLVNVNFPALAPEEIKGIRVAAQGFRDPGRYRIEQRRDPRGYDYYWFALEAARQPDPGLTDLGTVREGFVSVTPLHLDLTHTPSLQRLEALYR
jgi:5'-nucleotidase